MPAGMSSGTGRLADGRLVASGQGMTGFKQETWKVGGMCLCRSSL